MAWKQCMLVALLLGFAPFTVQGQLFFSSSSISWTEDDSGRVHQEIHQTQDEMIPHGGTIMHSRSEMACHDGNCQKRIVVGREPSQDDELRGFIFLGRIADSAVGKHHLRSRFIFLPAPEVEPSAPTSSVDIAQPAAKDVATQQGPSNFSEFWDVLGPALFAAVTISAAGSLVLYFACCRHSSIDARERPLAALAEPLATAAAPSATWALPSVPPAFVLSSIGSTAVHVPKEEEIVETPGPAFQFRPSVGTWLCQRLNAEEEEKEPL